MHASPHLLTPEKLGLPLTEWQQRMTALQASCQQALNPATPARAALCESILANPDLAKMKDDLTMAGFYALPQDNVTGRVERVRRAAAAQVFLAMSSANYLSLQAKGLSDAEIEALANAGEA